MRKKSYTLNFLSYYPHSEDLVCDLLECITLQQILFPAKLIRPEPFDPLQIYSGEEIKAANMLKEFCHDTMPYMTLSNENGIQISTNISYETTLGHHTIVIKFFEDFFASSEFNYRLLESLCLEIIPVFKPYYASAFNASRPTRETPSGRSMSYKDKVGQRAYPLEIRWITYFGIEMLEFLTVERFNNLRTYFKKHELDQGLLLILQEDIFQHTNEEHTRRQEQAEKELGFPELLNDD